MSSWSLLLALSGYHYSAPARSLSFAPRLRPEDFRCFFTAGEAWGGYAQRLDGRKQVHTLDLCWGSLTLERLGFPRLTVEARPQLQRLAGPAGDLGGRLAVSDSTLTVELAGPLTLEAGDHLVVEVGTPAQ